MSGDQQLTSLIGEIYDVPIDEVRRPILYLNKRCLVQDYRRSRRSGAEAFSSTQHGAAPVPKSLEQRVCNCSQRASGQRLLLLGILRLSSRWESIPNTALPGTAMTVKKNSLSAVTR